MRNHPSLSVLFLHGANHAPSDAFRSYLRSMPHVILTDRDVLPADLNSYHVVITDTTPLRETAEASLAAFVRRGGGWLCLVRGQAEPLPAVFGARLTPADPATELRIVFSDPGHPIARRMPTSFYCCCPYRAMLPETENCRILMYADWHYQHMPVLISGQLDQGMLAATTLQAYDEPHLQQILYRLLIHLSEAVRPQSLTVNPVGVGILGYAQSVGRLHGLGVSNTQDLHFAAACDLNAARLEQAGIDFPGITLHQSTDDLARDPNVDLVIVATAPNTHASLALQMMSSGKHVICEKPLALTRKEADAMLEMSLQQQVHLSCHQNRRFDVDYRAIRRAIAEDLIGDVFYMETFVGGFSHPCGYWHSHEPVSGGTAYDWGGHYLDWTVSLFPEHITSVTGTAHKRVWHDVTNADQERIHLLFAGGKEADFMHSDVAAVRKPKWYLLGTKGAIVSGWRDVVNYEIDPVLYYHEHSIPATEMTPSLTAFLRHQSGEILRQTLAIPKREHFLFHRNIADHLLSGEPLAAPLADSIKVVIILEAARQSVLKGRPVEVVNA